MPVQEPREDECDCWVSLQELGNNLYRLAAEDYTSIFKIAKMRLKRGGVSPKVTATQRTWNPRILPPDTTSARSLWGSLFHTELPHLFYWQLFFVPKKSSKAPRKHKQEHSINFQASSQLCTKIFTLYFYNTKADTAQALLKGSKIEMSFSS